MHDNNTAFNSIIAIGSKNNADELSKTASDSKKIFGLDSTYLGVVDSETKDFVSLTKNGDSVKKKSCTIVPFRRSLEQKHANSDTDVGFTMLSITFATPNAMSAAANLKPGDIVTLQIQASSKWINEPRLDKGGYYSTQLVCAIPPIVHFRIANYKCSDTRRAMYKAKQESHTPATHQSYPASTFNTSELVNNLMDDRGESHYSEGGSIPF